MSNTTTRIADLPDNITIQSIDDGSSIGVGGMGSVGGSMGGRLGSLDGGIGGGVGGGAGFYAPQPQQMQSAPQNPQYSQDQTFQLQQQMQSHYEAQQYQMQQHYEKQMQEMQHQIITMQQHPQQHRLPSRDIPMDTLGYMHDEEVKPSYIPESDVNEDYVRNREIMNKKRMKEHEDKKKNASLLDTFINELQTPVFIMMLFYVFQMPLVNTMIFKKFSFFTITNDDGNFNTFGLICKSFLFGSIYYILCKILGYIVEI